MVNFFTDLTCAETDENGLKKKFPDLKYFSLILADKPLFFPDFPDWKKSSKISLNSLISLIGRNPVSGYI